MSLRALTACLVLASGAARAEAPPAEAMARISPAVLRVEARDCGGAHDADGTGFLWGAADRAVTALHVVAGCTTLSVHSETLRRSVRASVTHVLLAADLALLQLDDKLDAPPAELAVAAPALHEDLAVLGYSLGAPTMGDHLVRIAYGSSRLSDIVSNDVANELQENGTPSVDLPVLRLDGVELPGNSGGPVLNHDGRVVGVGDGGLEQGVASVNWAIPASFVARLPASTDALPADVHRTRENFAAELQADPGQTVHCGDVDFRKVRTRPFGRLMQTTDDPLALQQVLRNAGSAAQGLDGLDYDVWEDAGSGGVIALPAGSIPEPDGPLCTVRDAEGAISVHFAGAQVDGVSGAVAQATQFERESEAPHGNLLWEQDPAWSYAFPHINGLDGVIVQRNSGYGVNPATGNPTAYGTETLMSRRNTFIGIAVVTDQYNGAVMTYCRFAIQDPRCAPVEAGVQAWTRYAVGVLLATFSAR